MLLNSHQENKKITISIENSELPNKQGQTDTNTISALCVSVKDEGIGIPEGELKNYFQ